MHVIQSQMCVNLIYIMLYNCLEGAEVGVKEYEIQHNINILIALTVFFLPLKGEYDEI